MKEEEEKSIGNSGEISVRRRVLAHSFQVFAVNQAFNTFLDHVDVGDESGGELAEDLADEVRVRELFALSVSS